jgi:hypothetical protein
MCGQIGKNIFRGGGYILRRVGEQICGLAVRFLATDPKVRVRFPTLPDILRSSKSGTGSTQPREYT